MAGADRFEGDGRVRAGVVGVLLVGQVGVADLAIAFTPPGSSVAAYWPGAGLGLAALVLARPRWRPFVIAGILLMTLVGNLLGGRELETSVGFALANAAEAGAAIWLLSRGGRSPALLAGVEDFIRFFVAAALGAVVAGVVAGATVTVLEGGNLLVTTRAVMASHLAAVLLLTPLAMTLPRDAAHLADRTEAVAQWATLLATVTLVFSTGQQLPLVFMIYPLLVWGALRFSPPHAVVQLVAGGVVTSTLTSLGRGPFVAAVEATGQPPELVGTLLQAHLLASVLVTLPLALMRSQRQAASDELRRSLEELDAILAATTGTALIGLDPKGTVEYFNVGAEQLTGHRAEDVVRRSVVSLGPGEEGEPALRVAPGGTPDPEEFSLLVQPLLEAASGPDGPSERHVSDWQLLTAAGEELTVSVSLTRRHDATGRSTGFLLVAEDVTHRRRQERSLEQALAAEKLVVDRLAQLDQAKNDFLATVSHELRTPVTSILGYSQLLLDAEAGDLPAQQQLAHRIHRNGRRLLGLIEDTLTMSQLEGAGLGFPRVPLDLREPFTRAVEATLPLLSARDLTLVQHAPEAAVKVAGDSDKLERAFWHLLSNAVKFSHRGGEVRVLLWATTTEACFQVRDTGIGIGVREQEQLFDRFFRGAQAHALATQGAGLGLSIASAIVSGHEGGIEIDSAPGRGSTFTIRLPLLHERVTGSAVEQA